MMSDVEQQWQQDIIDYGDMAFLMWETRLIYDNPPHDYPWVSANNNSLIYQAIQSTGVSIRRKESEELPFDLERAKAGDTIEFVNTENKFTIDCTIRGFFDDGILIGTSQGLFKVQPSELRMKYPPKEQL